MSPFQATLMIRYLPPRTKLSNFNLLKFFRKTAFRPEPELQLLSLRIAAIGQKLTPGYYSGRSLDFSLRGGMGRYGADEGPTPHNLDS